MSPVNSILVQKCLLPYTGKKKVENSERPMGAVGPMERARKRDSLVLWLRRFGISLPKESCLPASSLGCLLEEDGQDEG